MTNDKTRKALDKITNLFKEATDSAAAFGERMHDDDCTMYACTAIAYQKADSDALIRQLRDFIANRHNMGKQVRAAKRLEILSAADKYLGEANDK